MNQSQRFQFSKQNRLLKKSEFRHLFKNGTKINTRNFIAYVQNTHEKNSRLGLTVSKKVGNAIARNRIKRISREYFRKNKGRYKTIKDINLIAKAPVSKLSNEAVVESLKYIFDKIFQEKGY